MNSMFKDAIACLRRLSFFPALILAMATAAGNVQAADVATVEVLSAEFGTFDTGNPRETLFQASNVIPHKEGQRYGWIIELRAGKRSVSVREEYLLPNPVKPGKNAASADGTVIIPMDRRNQVSQRQLVPVDGKIYGDWAIGPGEPAGHRHLQVIVEDQLAADFEFDVK